jgi:hypothetical protein
MLKQSRGRMRFIGAPEIDLYSENWQSHIFEFKSYLRAHTQYQFIDSKVYWECDRDLKQAIPLLAIIGSSSPLERNVKILEIEAGPYWSKSLSTVFNFDFNSIKSQIKSVLLDLPPEMGNIFHLVLNDEKIELHFFLQKDYIG